MFLLSPAYCGGRRASILLNPESEAVTTRELRAGRWRAVGDPLRFGGGLAERRWSGLSRAVATVDARELQLPGAVAADPLAGSKLLPGRRGGLAEVDRVGAARVEVAAARRAGRVGDLALERDSLRAQARVRLPGARPAQAQAWPLPAAQAPQQAQFPE